MYLKRHTNSIMLCAALTCLGAFNISQAEVRDNSPAPTAVKGSHIDSTSHLKSAQQAWIKPRQVRCWQHGRLIVEENDWYVQKMGQHVSFSKGENQALYLFNFNDTFCIYRKSADK